MTNKHITVYAGSLVLVLAFQGLALSDQPPAAPAAQGVCDSAYPDAQGNMTIVCHGLNDDQVRRLATLDITKLLQQPEAAPVSEPPSVAANAPVPAAKPQKAAEPGKEIITYDYRGFKSSSITGFLAADLGESMVYQAMLNLQKAGDWEKLLKAATHEIKKVPDWLTPYAFKGVALQHLGETKEAIDSLTYVAQHSEGNPDYDQVRRLLVHLTANAAGSAK